MPSRTRNLPFTSVWIALSVCTLLPNPALATLTVDLRAVSTTSGTVVDSKNVLFTGGIGGTVTMEVFGVVSGYVNGDPNDDFVDNFHCSFLSSFGGLRGDLRAQLFFDWVDTFGSNGLRQDLDGDGDLDVGSNVDSSLANFFRAFAGQNAPFAPVVKVATLTWTHTGAGDQTFINARPRNVRDGAGWVVDSFPYEPSIGVYQNGTPVLISVVPEPCIGTGVVLLSLLARRRTRWNCCRSATDRPGGTVLVIPTRLGARPAVECWSVICRGDAMSYRIEQDDSTKRRSFGEYTYRIYDGDGLIAKYWHDHRGDEHGIEFANGRTEGWPVSRMIEFIEGGGHEPLRLSERARAYLKEHQNRESADK